MRTLYLSIVISMSILGFATISAQTTTEPAPKNEKAEAARKPIELQNFIIEGKEILNIPAGKKYLIFPRE